MDRRRRRSVSWTKGYRRLLDRYQPTSREAWLSVADQLGAIDARILRYILHRAGATCAEVEAALGLEHQTASAQISHMAKSGLVTDSGQTRPNAKGRRCIVWTVATREPQAGLPFTEAA